MSEYREVKHRNKTTMLTTLRGAQEGYLGDKFPSFYEMLNRKEQRGAKVAKAPEENST